MALPIVGIDGRSRSQSHDHSGDTPSTVTVIAADPVLCPPCGSVEPHAWLIRPQPAHCSPGCGRVYEAASAALLCLTCLRPTGYVPVVRSPGGSA